MIIIVERVDQLWSRKLAPTCRVESALLQSPTASAHMHGQELRTPLQIAQEIPQTQHGETAPQHTINTHTQREGESSS